jgi:hypothetical protein
MNCLLAATERDPETGSWIVPASYSLVRTHHTAGTAFKASGIIKADCVILEPVTAGGTNNKTHTPRASRANCLIHDNVRIAFVHTELIESEQFFRT